MIIKIPSRNIFSITHPIMPDNAINTIVINSNEVSKVVENNSVVNTTNISSYELQTQNQTNASPKYRVAWRGDSQFAYYTVAYLNAKLIYYTGKITIPKCSNNELIKTIYDGIETVGNDKQYRIKYNLSGTYTSNALTGKIKSKETATSWNDVSDIKVGDSISETNQPFDITTFPIESPIPISVTYKSPFVDLTSIISFGENNLTYFSPVTYDANTDEYTLEFKVLGGYEFDELVGGTRRLLSAGFPFEIYLDGYRRIFEPNTITIQLNGDKIVLDVKDDIRINSQVVMLKQAPFELQNNELLQSSNGYMNIASPVSGYYLREISTLRYINGREYATIKCSISDYCQATSSVSKFLVKGKDEELTEGANYLIYKPKENYNILNVISCIGYEQGGEISYTLITEVLSDNSIKISYPDDLYIYTVHITYNIIDLSCSILAISPTSNTNLPMTFNYFDKVIPMRFTAEKRDVPLFTYTDGTPKVFEVVAIKFEQGGIGTQTITIQAISQNLLKEKT